MPRAYKVIDATSNEVDTAKETAIQLISNTKGTTPNSIDDLFYEKRLDVIEAGIRNLNELSSKSWLLSSILLYTLIYNNNTYTQSGLSWEEYAIESRERLGMDGRDLSEHLSAARFFIQHHTAMERYGWTPNEANRKLARAELALELSGDLDAVLKHLANDSQKQFIDWYQSFKKADKLPAPTEYKRKDIDIKNNRVYIQGIEAVKVSDKIPPQDKERIEKYIGQIFEAIRKGYEPAIVDCYDEREARNLVNLRDKYRQKR